MYRSKFFLLNLLVSRLLFKMGHHQALGMVWIWTEMCMWWVINTKRDGDSLQSKVDYCSAITMLDFRKLDWCGCSKPNILKKDNKRLSRNLCFTPVGIELLNIGRLTFS